MLRLAAQLIHKNISKFFLMLDFSVDINFKIKNEPTRRLTFKCLNRKKVFSFEIILPLKLKIY